MKYWLSAHFGLAIQVSAIQALEWALSLLNTSLNMTSNQDLPYLQNLQ